MIAMMIDIRQQTIDALNDAYGRSQATPDGMYCRTGRIGRAYDIAATRGNPDKAMSAILDMVKATESAFAAADKAMLAYAKFCKKEGRRIDVEPPTCDCLSCRRVSTFGGVA